MGCQTCSGPANTDCIACEYFAYPDAENLCVCRPGFEGHECVIRDNDCDPVCNGCYGPGPDLCIYCVHNAYLLDGVCRCLMGWHGPACTDPCNVACDGCVGETSFDCVDCFLGYHKDDHG